MRFSYEKDNSKIIFTWRERITILLKGKLIFTDLFMKHFCNNLFGILVNFQSRFDDKVKETFNNPHDEVKTK